MIFTQSSEFGELNSVSSCLPVVWRALVDPNRHSLSNPTGTYRWRKEAITETSWCWPRPSHRRPSARDQHGVILEHVWSLFALMSRSLRSLISVKIHGLMSASGNHAGRHALSLHVLDVVVVAEDVAVADELYGDALAHWLM